jgi:predicted phage tail protein
MPVLVLQVFLWLASGVPVPPSPESRNQPESSVSTAVGILVVGAAVIGVAIWVTLKWLSARAAKRAESNVTTRAL